MKKNVLALIVTLIILIVGGVSLYSMLGDRVAPQASVTNEEGSAETSDVSRAPDFKVYDETGKVLTLSDLEGKPAVVNFWASWCGPCKSEMADFNEKYLELGDEVHFVMINLTDGSRETQQSAEAFVKGEGYEFPVYYDLDMTASESYEAYSIPLTYFIDDNGNAVAQANGAIDAETLQKGIDMITK